MFSIQKNWRRAVATVFGANDLFDLGLSADDLQSISENREVSSAGINNVSAKLGLTADQTRFVMQKMMTDAQQSQGNIQ